MAMALSLQLGAPRPFLHSTFNSGGNSNAATYTSTQRSQASIRCASFDTAVPAQRRERRIQPFIELLRDSATNGSVREGKSIHGFILKTDFGEESTESTVILLNHLAYMYTKQSNLVYAQRVFDVIPNRNVFSWTVMIVGSTEHGLFLDGFRFFCEMQTCGIWPDKFAYTSVVQACLGLETIKYGQMVHGQIVKSQFSTNVFVNTALLNMYAKFGAIKDSICLFKSMEEHNQVTWNALISGLANNDLNLEVYDQYCTMKGKGFEPNMFTFASLLKVIGSLIDVSKGKEVHQDIKNLHLESNIVVGTALIDMYSKCKCLPEARALFDKYFNNCNVNTPWNAMISGYLLNEKSEAALKLFKKMCHSDVLQDRFTYGSVLNACSSVNFMRNTREIHGRLVKFGKQLKVINVNNALCDAYSKCGLLEHAEKVFERMEERDVISWTTMVTAYGQCSEGTKALQAFSAMRDAGISPNQFTLASVLVACAGLCYLEFGRQIHGLLVKLRFQNYDCTESSLVDMYAKCGSLVEADKVFNSILEPDLVSWTAIISAYAQHGSMKTALQFFSRMEESGIKPNEVTILCVLFACSHGGLVDDGLDYFHSMKERYGIVPRMEHYACVVDLLGRVGRLDDALDFINSMPMEPTEMVWQNLLGACRVHGNPKMGEVAAKKILVLRPDYSATYVLLSNTFIEMGSLEDGLTVRDVMKQRGVRKEPGLSWIVIKGRIHKFFAGDQNHPQKDEIYEKLVDLGEKVKYMGYAPDLGVVSLARNETQLSLVS